MSEQAKKNAALHAVKAVEDNMILGIGTGSTTNYFIEALADAGIQLEGAVASSKASEQLLKKHNIPVLELNSVSELDLYIDGADEFNADRQLIKGGGAALTGEKIVVSCAAKFICIAHQSKHVSTLGKFPLPVEVIPMARSAVARALVKCGGDPVYRQGCITDYGNIILDVSNLEITDPLALEQTINQIPGVVTNGIFALNPADQIIIGHDQGVTLL